MKKIENLNQLKESAITITHPIKVHWPQYNSSETLSIDFTKLVDKTYAMNNSTIAFASEGALYVIPYMKQVMDILLENGFSENSMYVPFSNWEYPVAWESKWNDLKRMAKECN